MNSQARIKISGFSEYNAWTHLDPFYIYEPGIGIDDFRPVEYEERVTKIKLSLDAPIMPYWIGVIGVKINFTKGWGNRKHIRDADEYLQYNYPMTPYQSERDYIDYGMELYYGFPLSEFKPYFGGGGEFKVEQISNIFIEIDNLTNANAEPISGIPVDEHVERRLTYYLVAGFDYILGRYFYISPQLRLYFNDIEIKDGKMNVIDRIDKSQIRPMIEIGFIF